MQKRTVINFIKKKSIFSKIGKTLNDNPEAIIGGGIGFAVAGPFGAAIGGSMGTMDEHLKEEREDSDVKFP